MRLRSAPFPSLDGVSLLGAGGAPLPRGRSLAVGLLRMGYGHLRMGRAAAAWGARAGRRVFVHDPMAFPSPEGAALRAADALYCAASRASCAFGARAEAAWGRLMKCGGSPSQAASRLLARGLGRFLGDLPRDWPFIGAHPWNSHMAVEAGFKRVVNLVPDSDPQPFLVVPGAVNLAQNERSWRALLAMGVDPGRTAVAGHWVPPDLALNAAADSSRRLERLRRKAPVRLLFSAGGAGAQAGFLCDLIARLAPLAARGLLRLLLNAGDRPALAGRFERSLREAGLRVRAEGGESSFLERYPLEGPEPEDEAVLFRPPDALGAVAATDRLIRAADVLVTKPSELAFFPIPKLLVRRVGDHEALGALCAAELGDGTPERREPADAAGEVEGWLSDPGGLARLGEGVASAAGRGVYDGARAAVERALSEDGSGGMNLARAA